MYKSSKSSSKGKSKARWGEFSDWVWEPDQQFYYRVRQDADGNLDYDYDTTRQQSRPRSNDPVEEITRGVENLSPSSGEYEPEYQVASDPTSGSRGKSKTSKGKEKRFDYGAYEEEDNPRDRQRQPGAEENPDYAYTANVKDNYASYGDEEYQYAYRQDSSARQAYTSHGESAYSTPATAYDYADYQPSGPSAYAYPTYDTGDDGGRSTPKPGASGRRPHESSIMADVSEALDPRYRIERSDRFQPGEIFKAGWAEPKGSANDVLTGLSGKEEIKDTRGVTFVTGFRRFIVVANDQGHSTCVPILSYGGKACKKHGVKPEKHGIIYQRGQRPKLLSDEPKLGFPPVKVDITMEGEKLSKESRVNYSKLVTVEHNVKVMFIGTIVATDWPIVPDAINRCWDQKDHYKRRGHRK